MVDTNSIPNFESMSPEHQGYVTSDSKFLKGWMELIEAHRKSGMLDDKTSALCAIAVISAIGAYEGLNYMVRQAMDGGATGEEIEAAAQTALLVMGGKLLTACAKATDVFKKVQGEMSAKK